MFGIDIIDATLIPALTLAFLAGVISFLSPCVLPIVPPYLAYMSGISLSEATDNNKAVSVFLPAVFFVLGLSTVFLILGFTASALGTVFLSYQDILITISGLLVMGFGLHFLGILRIGFLEREARF
ncbi:MAG: cytochrome c biogenesis CcdA family protein, partial [Paracoccaceae bacterium]